MESILNRRLLLILGFVFIDLLGYSLILPLLPFYADTFAASLTTVGLLGTVNALAQLIAAPTIGRLSDRYGRRPLLIFSIVGTIIAFLLLGFAQSLAMLFISRIVDGLFGGNIALARAYITDITDSKTRARSLGMIGAAFGLGFIIGPAMGGVLSQYGFAVPAFAAAGLAALNLLAVLIWLPESLPAAERQALRRSPNTAFTLNKLFDELKKPCVGPLLVVQLFYNLAFILFQTNFALFAKNSLGLSAQSTSYILAYVGLLSVLVQAFAIGRLTGRFRERSLIFFGSILMTVSLLIWGFVGSVPLLLIILAPISLSGGILNTVITSQITKSVYREDVGGTLGLASALQSLAQILTPTIGGALMQFTGSWAVGAAAALFMSFAVLVTRLQILPRPEQEGPCPRADEPAAHSQPA